MMDWTFPFDGLGGGFGIFFAISAVLSIAVAVGLIVLLALGIRWLIRNSEGRQGGPGGKPTLDDTALAVLRERYARGEIDATEFEDRKRTLGG